MGWLTQILIPYTAMASNRRQAKLAFSEYENVFVQTVLAITAISQQMLCLTIAAKGLQLQSGRRTNDKYGSTLTKSLANPEITRRK